MQGSKGADGAAAVETTAKEIRVAVAESPRASSLSQVRFRPTTSKTEPDGGEEEEESHLLKDGSSKMRRVRQETLTEKLYRYRGVVIVISIPIVLIAFVLLMMPRISLDETAVTSGSAAEDLFDRQAVEGAGRSSSSSKRYSVVFDAGSSGSRVHVFCFDKNVDLVKMEDGELELFEQIKPGLSNYSDNPKKGAESLNGLLKKALDLVPKGLHSSTPVRLGATAGLRLLPGDTADEILSEVRLLLHKSGFKFEDEWVSILDGANEGTYQWITVNYLLGNLRKDFEETVGVVDLGGGSVQMSYAVSEEASKKAPKRASYIVKLQLLGQEFHLYVYSYLRYGLYAVRGEILRLVNKDATCPCLPQGYDGIYTYGKEKFTALADTNSADADGCGDLVLKALKKDEACTSLHCTFGGVWSGGGGSGQSNLLVASFFFDKAAEVGIIKDSKAPTAVVKPSQFEDMAKEVCALSFEEVESKYPDIQASDRPYLCMDLLYEYTLLVDGFGVQRDQEIKLVKRVVYKGAEVEAAWALGMAIESVSL